MRRAGFSPRAAAHLLGIHHSTLSREARRYPSDRPNAVNGYHAGDAYSVLFEIFSEQRVEAVRGLLI